MTILFFSASNMNIFFLKNNFFLNYLAVMASKKEIF